MNLLAELEQIARRDHDAMWRLPEYREALIAGRLHICGDCAHFTFGANPDQVGRCALHGEVFAFIPFACPDSHPCGLVGP